MRKKRVFAESLSVDLEAQPMPVLMHQYADRAKWTATKALLRMRSEATGAWPTLAGEPTHSLNVPISTRSLPSTSARMPKRQHIGLGGCEVDAGHNFSGARSAPLPRTSLHVPSLHDETNLPFGLFMQQGALIDIERGSSEEDESEYDAAWNVDTFAREISAAMVPATGLVARLERLHIAVLGGKPGPMEPILSQLRFLEIAVHGVECAPHSASERVARLELVVWPLSPVTVTASLNSSARPGRGADVVRGAT